MPSSRDYWKLCVVCTVNLVDTTKTCSRQSSVMYCKITTILYVLCCFSKHLTACSDYWMYSSYYRRQQAVMLNRNRKPYFWCIRCMSLPYNRSLQQRTHAWVTSLISICRLMKWNMWSEYVVGRARWSQTWFQAQSTDYSPFSHDILSASKFQYWGR